MMSKIRQCIAAARAVACEALGLAGISSIVAGVDMISRPAAMMIGGASALITAVAWARLRESAGRNT